MKEYNYDELKDSKLLYDKNPPALMPVIVILVTVLVCIVTFLSLNFKKTYVVKSYGNVAPDKKQYVMCSVGGEVIESFVEEGCCVQKGDVIAKIRPAGIGLINREQSQDKIEETFCIRATGSGTLHLTIPLNPGIVIQSGMTIATVSNNDDIHIDAFVTSRDRVKVSPGQEVKILVNGFNKSEYGYLKGKIERIDSDATVDEKTGNVLFKLFVKPETNSLVSKSGEKFSLVSGLSAEVNICYNKLSYFDYFREKIAV